MRIKNNVNCKKIMIYCIIFLVICSSLTPVITSSFYSTQDLSNEDFDEKIKRLMKIAHMPSLSFCIIKNNTTALSKGYGYADLGPLNKRNATIDDVYPIASITKSITATAIMILNESGLIGLDDNVSKYLYFDLKNPKYPNVNITPRMLLAHQSSIYKDSFLTFIRLYLGIIKYENIDKYYLPGGSFYHCKVWKNYPPGKGSSYSSQGINLLGYLVEAITNQSLPDFCQKNIFEPLKMYNTSFYFSDFEKKDIVRPYLWFAGLYIPLFFDKSSRRPLAAGGVKTTVSDLSHYLIMHTSGGVYKGVRILSEESIEDMHRAQYPDYYDGDCLHGLGWYYIISEEGEQYGGHAGNGRGVRTEMKMRYSDKVGVVYFWNQNRYFLYATNNMPPEEIEAQLEIEKTLFEKADEL